MFTVQMFMFGFFPGADGAIFVAPDNSPNQTGINLGTHAGL